MTNEEKAASIRATVPGLGIPEYRPEGGGSFFFEVQTHHFEMISLREKKAEIVLRQGIAWYCSDDRVLPGSVVPEMIFANGSGVSMMAGTPPSPESMFQFVSIRGYRRSDYVTLVRSLRMKAGRIRKLLQEMSSEERARPNPSWRRRRRKS